MELLNLMADRPESASPSAAAPARGRTDHGAERFEQVLAGAVERERDTRNAGERPELPTDKEDLVTPVDESAPQDDETVEEPSLQTGAAEQETGDEGETLAAQTKPHLSTGEGDLPMPEIGGDEEETPSLGTARPRTSRANEEPAVETAPTKKDPLIGDAHRALAEAKPAANDRVAELMPTAPTTPVAGEGVDAAGIDVTLSTDEAATPASAAAEGDRGPVRIDAGLASQRMETETTTRATGEGLQAEAALPTRETGESAGTPRAESMSIPADEPAQSLRRGEATRPGTVDRVPIDPEALPREMTRPGTDRPQADLANDLGPVDAEEPTVATKSNAQLEPIMQTPISGVEESAATKASEGGTAAQRVQPARPTPPEALPERTLKIVQEMKATGQTNYRAEIRLDPPELGRVHIELNVEGDRAWARLVVESAAAREQVRGELHQIRELLESQGLEEARVEVQLRQGGDHERGEGNGKGANELSDGDETGAEGAGRILRSAHDGVIDLRA